MGRCLSAVAVIRSDCDMCTLQKYNLPTHFDTSNSTHLHIIIANSYEFHVQCVYTILQAKLNNRILYKSLHSIAHKLNGFMHISIRHCLVKIFSIS